VSILSKLKELHQKMRQERIKSEVKRSIALLEGDDIKNQIDAAKTLGRLGNSDAVDPLMNVFKNKEHIFSQNDFLLFGYVAWALGELGATQAIKPIKKFIKIEVGGMNFGARSLQEAAEKMAKTRSAVQVSQDRAKDALEKLQKL
jgi:hypothetical protein